MTKLVLSSAFIALTLNLGACASLGPVAGPLAQETITEEVSSLAAPASWVFGAQTDGRIASDWAQVLSDPLLDAYIETALKNNPSLKASAESVARSEALLAQSRAGLLPRLGAGASVTGGGALEGNAFSDRYSANVDASWEADIWGGIRSGVLASGYDLAGTQATFESARQALIGATARAYVLAIEAEQQIALTQQTLAAQEETLRIVNVRYDLGAASRREQVLADSDVAGARDNLVLARSAKTDALLGLQILLGQYPDGTLDVSPNFPDMNGALAAGTPAEILRRRPDVLSSEYNVLAAFEAVKIARANKWPSLSLSGGLDTASGDPTDLLDPVSIAYSLGARLAGTLFDGGLLDARIDAASA